MKSASTKHATIVTLYSFHDFTVFLPSTMQAQLQHTVLIANVLAHGGDSNSNACESTLEEKRWWNNSTGGCLRGRVDGGVREASLNTAVWYSVFLMVRLPIIESKVAVPDVIQ